MIYRQFSDTALASLRYMGKIFLGNMKHLEINILEN
jgi:hypothetical protein